MKNFLILITSLISLTAMSQERKTVIVPPSKDTTIIEFIATTETSSKTTVSSVVTTKPTVAIPVPEDPAPPSDGYTLTATENFDKLSDLDANQIGVSSPSASLAPYFSTTVTYNSPGSFKSIVPAGGNNVSSGQRSEQQFNGTNNRPKDTHNPVEGKVEYDAYYENWGTVRSHQGHTWQWHPYTSGASANISLQNYGGTHRVVLSLKGGNKDIQNVSVPVASNKWLHHRWEFKWSTGSDGYLRLWIGDVKVCDYKGPTADGSGQYVKCGQNKWGPLSIASNVYYDNIKIYKKSTL